MGAPQKTMTAILNSLAIVLLLVLIGGWVERVFWEKVPRLLGVSEQILGALVLFAWLVWQGFQKFGRQKDVRLLRVVEEKDRQDD